MTLGGFHREDGEDKEMVEEKKFPTKEHPMEDPEEFLKMTIVQDSSAKFKDQREVTKALRGYRVSMKDDVATGRGTTKSRSPTRTSIVKTSEVTQVTPRSSLLEEAYHKQKEFRLHTPDSGATTLEDQNRGWKAHTPSPYYTEPQNAASRHVSSSRSVGTPNVPVWMIGLFKRLKDQSKDEHPYSPVSKRKEKYDQMPGRKGSWQNHQ